MGQAPTISVCIPTYNRGDMLPAAIESVLNQSYHNFELLILDNHSTDNTEAVLKQYNDPRIRVIRNDKTVSMYANHNLCAQHVKNDWVVFLHSDDQLAKDALNIFASYIADNPHIAVYFPKNQYLHISYVSASPMILSGPKGIASLCRWPTAAPTGAMYKKKWLQSLPFVENNLAADLLFLSRVVAQDGIISIIPEKTVQIGEGKFQTTYGWQKSGKYINDVALIFNEMISTQDAIGAVLEDARYWNAEEISRCLMFLAHADKAKAIRLIERTISGQQVYKKLVDYRHVWLYKLAGHAGLSLGFKLIKLVRSKRV